MAKTKPALEGWRGVALVQAGGEDVVAVAHGTTGGEPDTACELETRFQLASVSKQFTAAAVLLLADEGALSVDDPLSRWLEDCPEAWRQITLHQLLTHTAGLVHWPELPHLDLTAAIPPSELLRIFAEAPLLGPPGERYSYSSPGYVVAAHIVERASGRAYAAFLEEAIFEPLGMGSTFAGNGRGRPRLSAGFYQGEPVPSFELDVVGRGAGDVWSTAGDVARWDQALAQGEILSEAARHAMFSAHAPVGEDNGVEEDIFHDQGYGYGWRVASAFGHNVFFHTGGNAGFRSINVWFPDDGVRVIALSNDEAIDLTALSRQLILTAFPRGAKAG